MPFDGTYVPRRGLGLIRASSRELIPDGLPGTRATLKRMAQIARKAKTDPAVIELARQVVTDTRRWIAAARQVQAWVQGNVRYVEDPDGVETLQDPLLTVQIGAGDCDDQSILVASLLQSVGIGARFHAVGERPGELSHVYCEVAPSWLSVETTEDCPIGAEWPGVVEHMVQNV